MKKSKLLRKIAKVVPLFTIKMLVLALALYLFAFLHYDLVDINKRESHNVVISDLEYCDAHRARWAYFNANDEPAYYWFYDAEAARVGYKKLEKIADQKTEVTVTYSDYNSFLYSIAFDGRKQVADIRTEDEVIFDVYDYNKRILPLIIIWSVFATFCLALGVTRFVVYKKLKF